MDPDANWKEMASLDVDSPADRNRLKDLARALSQWLKGGGFPPKITGNTEFDRMVAKAACLPILCLCGPKLQRRRLAAQAAEYPTA